MIVAVGTWALVVCGVVEQVADGPQPFVAPPRPANAVILRGKVADVSPFPPGTLARRTAEVEVIVISERGKTISLWVGRATKVERVVNGARRPVDFSALAAGQQIEVAWSGIVTASDPPIACGVDGIVILRDAPRSGASSGSSRTSARR